MSITSLREVADDGTAQVEERFREVCEQVLGSALDRRVEIGSSVPQVFDFKELKASLPGEVVVATLTATEGGTGRIMYALARDDAARLADSLLMGDGGATFSHDEHLEPLRELFREVTAVFSSELGKQIGRPVSFDEVKASLVDLTPGDFVGIGWSVTRLDVKWDPAITVYRLVSKDFIDACYPKPRRIAEESDIADADDGAREELQKEMGLVLDIELPIAIELGRTSMLIRDIVKLTPGSIVELEKLSGEPVDLLVNNRKFARGEVVVVDENFAVRITELVVPDERLRAGRN